MEPIVRVADGDLQLSLLKGHPNKHTGLSPWSGGAS